MLPDPLGLTVRPFRVRPRPRHRETLTSYSRRLLIANHDDDSHRKYYLKLARAANQGASDAILWESIVETKAQLISGHFLRASRPSEHHGDGQTCSHCIVGLDSRWLCRLCAHGEEVQVHAHFGANVCVRHGLWIGPGANPSDQIEVTQDHRTAEAQFQRLRHRGRLSAPFYMELRHMFRTSLSAIYPGISNGRIDRESYPPMMAIATGVTNRSFLRELLDPRLTFWEAHAQLGRFVESTLGRPDSRLVRSLWLYLRPAFLSVREHLSGTFRDTVWEHDFRVPESVLAELKPPVGPLEPFRRYLAASSDEVLTEQSWRDVLIHHGPPGILRHEVPPASNYNYKAICRNGHRVEMVPKTLAGQIDPTGIETCSVCTNRIIEAGYNDLCTSHPSVAASFHPTRNGGGKMPTEIFAGVHTKYWWLCSKGHAYFASVSSRTRFGTGCSVCSGKVIIADYNSLAARRPDLAKEWHPTKNLFGPETVAAGSPTKAWWLCPRDHTYHSSPMNRSNGKGCAYCANHATLVGFNDLASQRPDLAVELHPSANGEASALTIRPTSKTKCFWLCPLDHTYAQAPQQRVLGQGCSVCAGKKLLPGYNDIASRYPDLANEWDSNRNIQEPNELLAGTSKYWWLCAYSHNYFQTVRHRVRSGGCPRCRKSDRIST